MGQIIPEGWEEKSVKQVAVLICDGDWIETKNQSFKGIRLIQTGNIGEGYYKDKAENARYISEETFKKLNCTEIFSGDCLVSRLPQPLGRACIIPDINERMITAVDCSIIRFNNKIIIPKYFIYYSMSDSYNKKVTALSTGATRQRISRKNLETITIPLPSLPEQQRIVAKLAEAFEAIDKAKANAEQNLINAKELFESALNKAFTENTEGWEEKTLKEISNNLDYKRIPITKNVRKQGIYPYYGASGIVDYVEDYIFDDTCLLVSEDGANLVMRNYPIAFSVSGKYWVNNHAHILKFDEMCTQRLVEFYLNHVKIDDYITGAAQPKLTQNKLNSIAIPFPPLPEQPKIVEKLDALQEQTKRLEQIYTQKIKECNELKQSILQKAFRGEL